MLIDFSTPLVVFTGDALKDADGEASTLGSVCINALLATFPNEQNLSGSIKLERYLLASKIHAAITKSEPITISVEEAVELKKLIGTGFNTVTAGIVLPLLDGQHPASVAPSAPASGASNKGKPT